ncbi:hypothetical protein PBY51_003229 [Eleginops maclovinus]|uniref:Uncharacterized protein n=1 Tax=Eleginops maclovinus TaxID=56733 RepID=A0AAN7X7P6_ELEMC|nr:hypothetical protein PBY51_003229 [Eleginops maclovinus]
MGDERAMRGSCLRQLEQLGLRSEHRVRARPHWWACQHSHCHKDDVGLVVAPAQGLTKPSAHFFYITVSSDKPDCELNRPSCFQMLLSASPQWVYSTGSL